MRYHLAAPLYSFLIDCDGKKTIYSLKQVNASCACGLTSMHSSNCRCSKQQTIGRWEISLNEGDEILGEISIPYSEMLHSACIRLADEMDGELRYFGSYDECIVAASQ